jgi:aryl-alcohol dehydrogenase-like predicted oxidoreductase
VSISRRAFLGAAALSPLGVKAIAATGKLPTRTLGSTGVTVPILAFGCGSRFMAYKDDEEAVGVLTKAIDLGFTYLDTANNYGNGRSEQLVGRLMPARRGEVFLQTKLAARKGDDARRQLEESLKRLKTDRLDLLHIHSLESLEDLAAIEAKGGVLETVRKAKDEKLTRFIGITGHANPQAMQAALERHDFDCVQMALNVARARMLFDDKGPNPIPMADASYETLALPVAVKKKMGIIAMKVFGQDRLLGAGASPEKLLYYSLSLPVSLATIGMPRPELLERNIALGRSFAPLGPAEMQSLRASIDESRREKLAQFFAQHRDA